MATNTYVALDKITVTGSAVPSITFTGISQGYTDLILVVNGKVTTAADNLKIQVGNGSIDTNSNYSYVYLAGDGASPTSGNNSSQPSTLSGRLGIVNSTNIIHFMNYSNTTTYKSILSRGNDASTNGQVAAYFCTWRSTAAINTIKILEQTGDTYAVGTTFSLYGVKAWAVESTPKAVGGYVSSDATYWYHSFPFSSTFVPSSAVTADVLVIAGGGSGGGQNGGGGGAGGLRQFSSQSFASGTTYTCTVGAGGGTTTFSANGNPGSNSSLSGTGFTTINATGGGNGSTGITSPGTGGSGGAGGAQGSAVVGAAGNAGGYSPVEGYAGGNGAPSYMGGGGGGAGGAGASATTNTIGGNGGIGATSALINSIAAVTGYGQQSGSNYYFAGGGGGGTGYEGSAPTGVSSGGLGGGGNGGVFESTLNPTNGRVSTGSGGGGQPYGLKPTSAGGSGLIVIRYAK
jgi:hypothetical protein